jgi:hypothetical protein
MRTVLLSQRRSWAGWPSVSHGADLQYVSSSANEVLTGAVAAKGQERCDRVMIDMLHVRRGYPSAIVLSGALARCRVLSRPSPLLQSIVPLQCPRPDGEISRGLALDDVYAPQKLRWRVSQPQTSLPGHERKRTRVALHPDLKPPHGKAEAEWRFKACRCSTRCSRSVHVHFHAAGAERRSLLSATQHYFTRTLCLLPGYEPRTWRPRAAGAPRPRLC